jgi:hypothetical protein
MHGLGSERDWRFEQRASATEVHDSQGRADIHVAPEIANNLEARAHAPIADSALHRAAAFSDFSATPNLRLDPMPTTPSASTHSVDCPNPNRSICVAGNPLMPWNVDEGDAGRLCCDLGSRAHRQVAKKSPSTWRILSFTRKPSYSSVCAEYAEFADSKPIFLVSNICCFAALQKTKVLIYHDFGQRNKDVTSVWVEELNLWAGKTALVGGSDTHFGQ